VAVLGTALTEAGLNHMLIGIPEAHPEALSTLAAMCGYALGLTTSKEVRIGFASFLTASTRSPKPPELAVALASGKPLPPGFETGLKEFESELRKAKTGTIGELVTIASNGWKAIRITSGLRPWRRACLEFAGLARPLSHLDVTPESVRLLMSAVDRRKSNALIDHEVTGKGLVQLMNFFQTKGREADAVILVYRSGDYLADRAASEPFEDASRVLFVSITRARQKVVIILPDYPHALIAPFEAFAA
jgi:DNA helicase-2/ATP-dependent DNA helicase PcrA